MNDRIEGTAREFGGRVQEAVGNVAGDSETQARGLYNQAAGQAQQAASLGHGLAQHAGTATPRLCRDLDLFLRWA